MSRTKTRTRRRCARIVSEIKALLDRSIRALTVADRIAVNEELVRLLQRIARSDQHLLWSYFSDEDGLDEDEPGDSGTRQHNPKPRTPNNWGKIAREEIDALRALIAQLVAPHLSGRLPRRVRERAPQRITGLELPTIQEQQPGPVQRPS